MSNNDELIKSFIEKLSKGDAFPIIIVFVFTYLYYLVYPTLGTVSNKFKEPYGTIFSLFPLAIILLIIMVGGFIIIINLISKFLKNKDSEEDDDMTMTKLGTFNQSKLNELINQFELSHTQAKRLSTRMRLWKSGGDFELQDKLDLANWCKIADDNRKQAREIARKISMLVFGKDISKK